MWLKSPNISCTHGFSTRHGGVSPAPFDTLNLGGSDDIQQNIETNRCRGLGALKLNSEKIFTLRQVHSDTVCEALSNRQEGDALVSNRPGDVIAVLVADCYPVLFYDEKNRVIGAAHCGWRGTAARLASKTVERMVKLGADKKNIRAAIGQGISQKNFEVGPEVIQKFTDEGFPQTAMAANRIDLVKCIQFDLLSASISPENIWAMNRCTFEPDFFSYRRDKGKTGRMMGVIALS